MCCPRLELHRKSRRGRLGGACHRDVAHAPAYDQPPAVTGAPDADSVPREEKGTAQPRLPSTIACHPPWTGAVTLHSAFGRASSPTRPPGALPADENRYP